MLQRFLRKFAKYLRILGDQPSTRVRSKRSLFLLESLESRDLPAPLTWAAGVNLPMAEGGIVAQPQGTSLLVLGGPTTTSYNLTVTDPTWQANASQTYDPLDFARSSPGVGQLPNGYVIVFGGTQNGFATAAATQYDPNGTTTTNDATGTTTKNTTTALRSMSTPRTLLGYVTDRNLLDYAIGGQNNNGTPLATMEVYNPTANSWSYLASLPQTLYSESAASDGAGHLYTFGGVRANGAITNNVYRYTIATNTWDQMAPLQVGVSSSAAVLGSNGLIYVLGGATAAGTTASVESYNITSNTWTIENSLPYPVSSEAAAVDSLGRIEVLGGYDANNNAVASIAVSQKLSQPDLAPTITSDAPTAGVLNRAYAYQVFSTGNPQASYSVTGPAGMTVNAGTGLISWTPSAVGSFGVTVQAGNGVGLASQSFTINVTLPTPAAPTGVTGTRLSATTVGLSWDASTDPYLASYNVYKRFAHVYHSPRGSGGGVTYTYSLVASGLTTTSVVLAGSGPYAVAVVNSAGMQSPLSALVNVFVQTPPDLYVATTISGADISSQTLSVGQTGQIRLIQTGANPAPTFSVVTPPNGAMTVDPTSGLVTYTPSPADIGNVVVTFKATNAAGSSTITFTYVVSALTPTVTVSGGTFTYDGNTHTASASAIGVDGVTPVSGTFAITYNGTWTLPTAAGTYAILGTFTSADTAYASVVGTGTLTINRATPNIAVSGGPFNYDGTAHAVTAKAVGVDGISAVDGYFQFTYNGDPTPPTGPGLYTVAASFASNDPNYASVTVSSNLIINSPGTLVPTLSLVDGSALYDGNAHADSGTAVDHDNSVAGAFLTTYNGSTMAPTQAGTYAVVATFISSDINYSNATVIGTLTISAVAPMLVVDPTSFYYDGTTHSVTVTALGVDQVTSVNGMFAVTYNGSPTPPVNAGTYDVTATFTSNDSIYLSTSITTTLTILPANSSVGLLNGQWIFTYDGTPQSVVGIATGIDGVTPINGTFSYLYYNQYGSNTMLFGPPLPGAPVDAGYYTFTEYFTSLDPNYADGTFSWAMNINSAASTVSIAGGPYTYNGTSQGATVTAVGIDGVTPVVGTSAVTYNGSSSVPSVAGTYAVHADFASGDPNYYGSSADGTLVIYKATPAFNNLASPAVNAGTATVTVSGHIAAGSAAPNGDAVSITLNGTTQSVSISSGGSFSTSFNIQGLATGTYPIAYEFLGDATRFNAAGTGFASGTLTVQAAPSILTSPVSQTVVSGAAVTFSASASGYPAPTVQWQVSTNGTTYTNITGATSPTFTISATTAGQNGYRYRAVFTNSVGSATTAVATLTVQSAPTITASPSSKTVNAGQSTTLTAAATGNPAPTVQWQVSTDGGTTYSSIAGATSTTLSLLSTTAAQNGYKYRAVFTNSVGSAATAATMLTVRFAPIVTTNPANQSSSASQSVTFTAAATGNSTPTVQWQVSTNGGTSYSNIAGATSTTFTVSSITSSQNGYRYRAVFTNSLGSASTAAALLTVL